MTGGLKAKLAERISAGKVLVVVGTGVSLASTDGDRLASWKGLIANGVEHCAALGLREAGWVASQKKLLEGDLDDLLGVAEQVSRRLGWKPTEPCGGDWNGWLRGTVGGLRAKHQELIKAIRDLGTPIATLNYDNLLTDVTGRRSITWQRAERWLPVLQGEDKAILHLHGHWDHPSSVVLGIRSYDAVLGQGLAQHLERALTSWLSLAFIGCSATLEDPNFSALLTWMREQLSGTEHSHYLLIREKEPLPVATPLLRQARVVPLPYGKGHADLLPFIRDLAKPPNKSGGASSTGGDGYNDFAPTSTSPNNIEHESEPKSGGFDPSHEARAPDFSTKPYKEGDLTHPPRLRPDERRQHDEGRRQENEKRVQKLKKEIGTALLRSKAAAFDELQRTATGKGWNYVEANTNRNVSLFVDWLMAVRFQDSKDALLETHESLKNVGCVEGTAAVEKVSRLLLPWVYVAGTPIDTSWWGIGSIGDVVGLPCGLTTFAEIVMAGLERREVLFVDGIPDWPGGRYSISLGPESGMAPDFEKNLREDLWKISCPPPELSNRRADVKDKAIANQLAYLDKKGIKLYVIVRLPSAHDPEHATFKGILQRLVEKYTALTIVELDESMLLDDQNLFNEIRHLLIPSGS